MPWPGAARAGGRELLLAPACAQPPATASACVIRAACSAALAAARSAAASTRPSSPPGGPLAVAGADRGRSQGILLLAIVSVTRPTSPAPPGPAGHGGPGPLSLTRRGRNGRWVTAIARPAGSVTMTRHRAAGSAAAI